MRPPSSVSSKYKNMQTHVYGLVGRKLGHSFSKTYFGNKFAREGIDAVYLNFELPDAAGILRLREAYPGLRGFNVTIPYKEDVLPLLDAIDPTALEIGAVNTVRVDAEGRLTGYNTDAPGFAGSLKDMLGGTPVPSRALVCGTGGASKAVVHALRTLGCTPTLLSRKRGRGQLCYDDITPETVREHTLIVNTTPLGTAPDCDSAPALPYGAVTPAHYCFDLVYNPDPTRFMQLCAARGAAVRSGLDMLHRQAEAAWHIWNEKS